MNKINSFSWQVGFSDDAEILPENFFKATVPGAVQLDYFAAYDCEPYWKEQNILQYSWLEKKYWTYRTNFNVPGRPGKNTSVIFRGLDYKCLIRINGKTVLENEGMFVPVKLDLTAWMGTDIVLEILFYPPPAGKQSALTACKPMVSYGWDFHPHILPIGIWDDVILEVTDDVAIDDFNFTYKISPELDCVDINAEISVTADCEIEIELINQKKEIVAQVQRDCLKGENTVGLILKNPQLWWPVGLGEPYLYEIRVTSVLNGKTTSCCEKKVGFRRSELRMNDGEWQQHVEMPKTRNKPPIALYINNHPIFVKGGNLVPLDIFYGSVTASQTKELLNLVKEANMNLVRVWGGGVVNKENFYEMCDEIGLMVWQEFTLACGEYPNDEHYLGVLEQQAIGIVKRLRLHPSVVLWCGGNELFNAWSCMTDQHHALRLLNQICYTYDRQTPFLMTSPLYGMAHGNYLNVERGGEILTRLLQRRNTAYTEFGSPGASLPEYVRQFMSEEEFNNLDAPVWKTHHAFGMWMYPDTHLRLEEVNYYYGGWSSTEDLLIKLSRIQSANYRMFFEEMRRQWPYCSMAINWCVNEPWPTAANNSIINWPLKPKPSYESVKLALRDNMASLRVEKQLYTPGEIFEGQLWVLNDSLVTTPAGVMKAYLVTDGKENEILSWHFGENMPQRHQQGATIGFSVPECNSEHFFIRLRVNGHPEMDSEYLFFLDPKYEKAKNAASKTVMMNT